VEIADSMVKTLAMGKNLGQVFSSRCGCGHMPYKKGITAKQPHNLNLKTRPNQLLGFFPLVFELPSRTIKFQGLKYYKNIADL
jgi:hypothetical protein